MKDQRRPLTITIICTLVVWLLLHQTYRYIGTDGARVFGTDDMAMLQRAMLVVLLVMQLLLWLATGHKAVKYITGLLVLLAIAYCGLSLLFGIDVGLGKYHDGILLCRETVCIAGCAIATLLTRLRTPWPAYVVLAASVFYALCIFLQVRSTNVTFILPFFW